MALVVKHAIYGALVGGEDYKGKAFDVTASLQNLINGKSGVVPINNSSFGDPAPGNGKHFGAVVTRDGTDCLFACQENQTIDFNHGGGIARKQSFLTVKFAVFGALNGGNSSDGDGADVTALVQSILNATGAAAIDVNAETLGDPSPNNLKHFAAIVSRGGKDFYFACQEGQGVDFAEGGGS
jgi:hypothetical protein